MTSFDEPEVVQFLASSLAKFMEVNRLSGQKWSKLRVATYISRSEDISGSISDTTIGRFLDPSYKQEPSVASVAVVRDFLLLHRWISKQQIEVLRHTREVQIAAALGDFFPNGNQETQADLLNKLEGPYVQFVLRDPYLLESRLFVTHHERNQLLTCYEILTLYRVSNCKKLRELSKNLARESYGQMTKHLWASGGHEVASHVMSGAAVANTGLVAFFMKPTTAGFAAIAMLDAVNFDDDDRVWALNGSRNRGWVFLDEGETLAPSENLTRASPHHALRAMCGTVTYWPQFIKGIQARRVAEEQDVDDDDVHYFRSLGAGSVEKALGSDRIMDESDKHLENCSDPDERMRLAIEWGRLDAFRDALASGADPNFMLGESQMPIVFYLAGSGRKEWVETLVLSGQCDLTVRDKAGLSPSHYPALTARIMACQDGPKHLVRKFTALSGWLLREEARQLIDKGLHPPITPS